MEEPASINKPKGINRDKTCPFLLRAFVKVNGYHPISLFEDQKLPIADEHQIYTWPDATLRELVTYLRSLPPSSLTLSLRHPAARYSFRLVFADATSHGRMMTKDLGSVHARDIVHPSQLSSSLEEGTMDVDNESENVNATVGSSGGPGGANDHSRNLEELRVQPGDWLLVAIYLPVKAMGMSIAGAAGASSSPTISSPTPLSARGGSFARGGPPGAPLRGDAGWGRGRGGAGVPEPAFGGHWRGRGAGPAPSGMGRGREREVDRDVKPRRPSPTGRDRDRRPSPTGRDRDRRRSGSRDRSRTRSRSPPPRRRSRTSSRSRSRSPPRRKRD